MALVDARDQMTGCVGISVACSVFSTVRFNLSERARYVTSPAWSSEENTRGI
jgi:hypothetical protein